MITRIQARLAMSESGFTLIELIVSASISILVMAIIGSLLTNSMRIESQTRTVAQATDVGQLIARSVQSGVRNASKVSLTNVGSGQFLVVRTAGRATTPSWSCQAWYYTPDSGGAFYMKTTTPAAAIASPTVSTLSSWTKLGTGISPVDAPILTAVLGLVTIKFSVSAGDSAPIPIMSTATMRTLETESTPCF